MLSHGSRPPSGRPTDGVPEYDGPMHRRRLLLLVLVASVCAISLYAVAAQSVSAGPRLVAIGDIHGAGPELTAVLRAAGLVDASGRWRGGATHLVQTGDFTDRGTHVREVMDTLMRLEAEARRAGGRAEILMGNHEAMNLLHDFRDVSPETYAAFADPRSEDRRRRAYREYVRAAERGGRTPATEEEWNTSHPPGFVEYVEALAPRGRYGRWLRERKAIHVQAGTIFMHAGISDTSTGTIEEINEQIKKDILAWDAARDALVREDLARPFFTLREIVDVAVAELQRIAGALETKSAPGDHVTREFVEHLQFVAKIGRSPLVEADGPLWFRGYAQWTDEEGEKVTVLLKRLGAERFVTAHTPQPPGILPRFANRVFLIDTGMLTSVYKGRPSALELQDGTITAIYTDQRQVLSATTVR